MIDRHSIASPLRQAVASGALPGVAAAAATAEEVLFSDAFGVRDLATGAPMQPDTVVWLASMTKAITAACAMQLVEQGQLTLDGDLAALVPELAEAKVLEGFDPNGHPRLRAPHRPITLRHLLTHTSGFAYDMWNADIIRYMQATGTPTVISCQNAALTTPLVADPGTRWEYGISIDWAGKAVEAVSGQTLSDYMQDHLLRPLGMHATGFRLDDAARSRRARIHARTADGLAPTDMEIPQQPEFHMGGGGLYGTVGDYLRFCRMVLRGGELDGARVLAPETVALMSANAIGDLSCRKMVSAIPAATLDVDMVSGMKWGLSFMINPDPLPTGRSAGSLAWAGLANTYFWIDPARGVAGVHATQVLPFADPAALDAFAAFETAVYRALA